LFRVTLERSQLIAPERFDFIQPLPQTLKGLRLQLINSFSTIVGSFARADNTGAAKDSQVTAHRRTTHAEVRSDFAGQSRLNPQHVNDGPAIRFGQCRKGFIDVHY
jgi:hypothetical protein